MTLLQIRGLSEVSWSIGSADLEVGHWVLLVQSAQVADQLARLVVGLIVPPKGRVLVNGHDPSRDAATRARCSSLFVREPAALGTRVREFAELFAMLTGSLHDPVKLLDGLDLHPLASWRCASLTPSQRRQLALSFAMAQSEVDLAVYCEPLLGLSAAQCAVYREHVAKLSQRSCVLSVTASEHDALQLGGPHAHITRQGWHWVDADLGAYALNRLHVEGVRLGPVVAQVAALPAVARLHIHKSPAGIDYVEIATSADSGVAFELVRAAHVQQAQITRIFTTADHEPAAENTAPMEPAAKTDWRPQPVAGWSRFGVSLRSARRALMHAASRLFTHPLGICLLLGQPLLAALYAYTRGRGDPTAAVQESLEILVALLVPLSALYLTRVMNGPLALGGNIGALARYGANRRVVLAVNWLTLVSLGAVVGGGSAVATLLAARGSHGLALVELSTAAWIVALGSSVYVGLLQYLPTPSRGWLLWLFLLSDYSLGGANLGVSALFPHAHLLNLLGASSAPLMPQQASCIFLGALSILALGLALRRTPP